MVQVECYLEYLGSDPATLFRLAMTKMPVNRFLKQKQKQSSLLQPPRATPAATTEQWFYFSLHIGQVTPKISSVIYRYLKGTSIPNSIM